MKVFVYFRGFILFFQKFEIPAFNLQLIIRVSLIYP